MVFAASYLTSVYQIDNAQENVIDSSDCIHVVVVIVVYTSS